jgi:GxxExxY protein
MQNESLLHRELTEQILSAFYQVYNSLGAGFLEKVYENALLLELEGRGLAVKQQTPIKVYYASKVVGEYFADLVVENKVLLELKAGDTIHQAHLSQLNNYLRARRIEVGLILNFGTKPEFKRRVFTNDRKLSPA